MQPFEAVLNVVTIGGGGGHSAVIKALKDLPISLTALCNTVDDGGGTGKLVREYGVHSGGDVRQVLTTLGGEKAELLQYRFSEGSLSGYALGSLLIAGIEKSSGSFQKAIDEIRFWFQISHQVAPITENTPVLHARTKSGKEIVGQAEIVRFLWSQSDPIETIWISPVESSLSEVARQALQEADYIIIPMGDLYSSIAPSFCISELQNMWSTLKAKIIWLPNVAVTPGHVHYVKQSEALKFLQTLIPSFQPNIIITQSGELSESVKKNLAEKSYGVSINDIQDSQNTKVMRESLIDENFVSQKIAGDSIERSPIRYDIEKLKSVFEKILV